MSFQVSVIANFYLPIPNTTSLILLTQREAAFAIVANLAAGAFYGFPVAVHVADVCHRIGNALFFAWRAFFYAVTVKTEVARASTEHCICPKTIFIACLSLFIRNAPFIARGAFFGKLDTGFVLTKRFVGRTRLPLPNGIDAYGECVLTNTFHIAGGAFGGIAFVVTTHGNIGRTVHKTPEVIRATNLNAGFRHTS